MENAERQIFRLKSHFQAETDDLRIQESELETDLALMNDQVQEWENQKIADLKLDFHQRPMSARHVPAPRSKVAVGRPQSPSVRPASAGGMRTRIHAESPSTPSSTQQSPPRPATAGRGTNPPEREVWQTFCLSSTFLSLSLSSVYLYLYHLSLCLILQTLPVDVVMYQEFVGSHGLTGGWGEAEHSHFVRLYNKHTVRLIIRSLSICCSLSIYLSIYLSISSHIPSLCYSSSSLPSSSQTLLFWLSSNAPLLSALSMT